MATWPNNYRAFGTPGRTLGNLAYSKYTGTGGGRLDLFTSGSAKTASAPNGYGMLAGMIQPIRAGGISSYNTPVSSELFTGNALSGGPVEGSASVVTLTGNNMSLSLVISLGGTSTITLAGNNNVLRLTVGLGGTGTWTMTGNLNVLSLIVPFEGLGAFALTGISDLRGILSMEGEWTPFSTLSPENLARAVWEAAASQYDASGTMGEKLNDAGSASNPWTEVIESGMSAADILRVVLAVLAGESTIVDQGGGIAVVEFANVAGTKPRVTADMDGSERTSLVLDGTL